MTGINRAHLVVLARVIAVCVVLATLCNGAGVYLKRTGLMEADAYHGYWKFHCSTLLSLSAAEAAAPRCCASAQAAQMTYLEASARTRGERAQTRYVYRVSGAEHALKLAKDVFGLALLSASLLLLARRSAPFMDVRQAWPAALLLAYAGLALLASLVLYEPLVALAGVRAFLFLGLALLGLWLVPHMALLAAATAALLALQVVLMPFELLRGVHLHGHFHLLPLAGRLSGTLVLPNTLGAFAACALAFYCAFAADHRWLWPVTALALVLIIVSGSGTGVVCAGLFAVLVLMRKVPAPHRWLLIAAAGFAGALSLAFLPEVLGRPRVFESLWGRMDGLLMVLSGKPSWQMWFGSGLGVDTNTMHMLLRTLGADSFPRYSGLHFGSGESQLSSLLTQLGWVGTVLFYGTLAWAAVRDGKARVFYAMVAVCSLTLQVTELFPVNFLLGVALAHSVVVAGRGKPAALREMPALPCDRRAVS